MRKILILLLTLAITFYVVAQPVFAGGGQVTGEKGQGTIAQEGPCPFGGDTPVGPNN